jgi:hypothetical protein
MNERREEFFGGKLTRTLDQVLYRDYFCTHKTLREMFIPNYDPREFDSITPALCWIKSSGENFNRFSEPVSTNKYPDNLPDYVKQNQATISLWLEIAINTVGKREDVPVAFSPNTHPFYQDLRFFVSPEWKKLSSQLHETKNVDEISSELFRGYWISLFRRQKFILKSSRN